MTMDQVSATLQVCMIDNVKLDNTMWRKLCPLLLVFLKYVVCTVKQHEMNVWINHLNMMKLKLNLIN